MTAPATVSGDFTYAIRVTNNGPSTAKSVVGGSQVPSNVTFVSVSPPRQSNKPKCDLDLFGSAPGDAHSLQCDFGDIPTGTTFQVNLTVRPKGSGPITNEFAAGSFYPGTSDPNISNNRATFANIACAGNAAALPTFNTVSQPYATFGTGSTPTYTYRVRATDKVGGGRVTYALAQKPDGMTLTNYSDGSAVITWTPSPSLQGQALPVGIVASILAPDGSPLCNSSAPQNFSLTVVPPGPVCLGFGKLKLCSEAIVPTSSGAASKVAKTGISNLRPDEFPNGTYQLGGNTK